MSERTSLRGRMSLQALAKFTVAVLVLIAIAGFVLATIRGRNVSGVSVSTPSTAGVPATMTTAARPTEDEIRAETDAGPNGLVFAPNSDQISDRAAAKLEHLAIAARDAKRAVTIGAKIEIRGDRSDQMELAKKRTFAVRSALNAQGIPLGTISIHIDEMPKGLLPSKQANRVEVALR